MPAVSGLTEAQWTNLQTLDLSYSNLGQSGMMHLALGQWPLLSKLDISQIQDCADLTPNDYADLAEGSWPRLTYLSLAHNGMNDECAVELNSGNWPLLATINLSYNTLALLAVLSLLWPSGHTWNTCVCMKTSQNVVGAR